MKRKIKYILFLNVNNEEKKKVRDKNDDLTYFMS
jgi:hypothetical protein